jgi:hypothetical protein
MAGAKRIKREASSCDSVADVGKEEEDVTVTGGVASSGGGRSDGGAKEGGHAASGSGKRSVAEWRRVCFGEGYRDMEWLTSS